jgi:hypothetical protein
VKNLRNLASPARILLGVWVIGLIVMGLLWHHFAWLLLLLTAVALGFSFLVNVGTAAGQNWSKALYGNDQESRNHWSRKGPRQKR